MRARTRSASGQVAAGQTPFASFFERQEEREKRARGKRRMLYLSVLVHIVVFGSVMLVSAWKVDELFGRSVEVNVVPQPQGQGPDGKPAHHDPTNVGRALGLRLVVTPQGARSDPRPDRVPVEPALLEKLRPLVLQQLLPLLQYPTEAESRHLRGSVTVLVDVDESGTPTQVDVRMPCMNELLCQAAKDAVLKLPRWPVTTATSPRAFAVPIDYRAP